MIAAANILVALAAVATTAPPAQRQLEVLAGPEATEAAAKGPPATTASAAAPRPDPILYSLNDAQAAFRFTADQYRELLARGGELRPAAGSDWVPPAMRKAVLDSIAHAFAHGMADELSWRDFFHGHVELDRGAAMGSALASLAEARGKLRRQCGVSQGYSDHLHSLIGRRAWPKTPKNFARDLYATPPCDPASLVRSYVVLLEALAANPGCHVLFHTRETTFERLDPQKKNRTILTRLGGSPATIAPIPAEDPQNMEPVGGSIQLFFFVTSAGEVVFYPSEDVFLMQRGWLRDTGSPLPF